MIFGGSPSYRRKLLFIALAMVVGIGSLLFSNKVVRQLASKERSEIRLWSHAMAMMGDTDMHDSRGHSQLEELIREITEDNTTIPSIITDKNYRVLNYSNISEQTVSSSEKLRAELERMASKHDPKDNGRPHD